LAPLRDRSAGAGHGPARRRGLVSPLTRRILTVNVLALAILVAGLLYLVRYEESLVANELTSLAIQAEIFAGALGEGAHATQPDGASVLQPEVAATMLRRLVVPTRTRARLFGPDGQLIADSRVLAGPGGAVQVETLAPPDAEGFLGMLVLRTYEAVVDLLPARRHLPHYREQAVQRAADYDEVIRALAGEPGTRVRERNSSGLVLSAAVPVQRFKQVLGALLLTADGHEIDRTVRAVRLDILKVFLVVLCVTVLLSLYLGSAIVRPLRRLAAAATRVRRATGREHAIPDFSHRGDEIGDLSTDLREMTEALWLRMDAIESFAADVAHEIKNPLTSLRSAVETAARVKDPEQQRRLMSIVLDDVQRLDRLISDISSASRLDAELSRTEMETVDLGRLLAALAEVHGTIPPEGRPALVFEAEEDAPLAVFGNGDRLVQVFQNLLSNAFSFGPPGTTVSMRVARDATGPGAVIVTVDDEGPGIPPGSEERIFERFYSERPEGERFGTHSGLGLNISRQIVEAHGGSLVAENRIGEDGAVRGARFTVRLPAV
jgi:two-component system, OmpR family, sensor histidine kinase ChvG